MSGLRSDDLSRPNATRDENCAAPKMPARAQRPVDEWTDSDRLAADLDEAFVDADVSGAILAAQK